MIILDSGRNSPTEQYSNALSSPFGQSQSPPVSFMARPFSLNQPPGSVHAPLSQQQPPGSVQAVPTSQLPSDKTRLAEPSRYRQV